MNILSLGAGVQSSTVLLMSCRGVLPKLDGAIFADTQWETKEVYQWLTEILEPESANAGIPLYRVTAWDIRADALRSRMRAEEYKQIENGRWASMPLYTQLKDKDGEGMIGLGVYIFGGEHADIPLEHPAGGGDTATLEA